MKHVVRLCLMAHTSRGKSGTCCACQRRRPLAWRQGEGARHRGRKELYHGEAIDAPRKERTMITKHLMVGMVVLLLVGWGIAPAAAGTCLRSGSYYEEGVEDLGGISAAVDVWKLACPSGTSRATANIIDLSSQNTGTTRDGILFTLLTVKGTTGSTTLRHANDASSSSDATVNGGSGTYYLQIHKNITTSTPVDYVVHACCLNTSGASLPSSFTLIQDR